MAAHGSAEYREWQPVVPAERLFAELPREVHSPGIPLFMTATNVTNLARMLNVPQRLVLLILQSVPRNEQNFPQACAYA